MPELPEVQTVVDTLRHAGIVGKQIVGIKENWSKTISDRTPESFSRRIKGLAATSIWRRGKYNEISQANGVIPCHACT